MMKKETVDLPVRALQLANGGGGIETDTSGDVVQIRNFVGYTGGIIEGHWYWDKLAIDLDGIRFEKNRYPILLDHWDDAKLGHSGVPEVDGALRLPTGDIVFLDNKDAEKFLSELAQGFPFEASIYAIPGVIEEISAGSSVMVN